MSISFKVYEEEAQSFKDVSWWFFLFEKNNADFMVFNETAEWHWHHGEMFPVVVGTAGSELFFAMTFGSY